jgi:REP element-mobilizing transposase RayT
MKLYEKYIDVVANTFAWVLMPNHFHFLVQIKEENQTTLSPTRQFSNLFNAYAQAYNKRYNRHGALFERPFKRKPVSTEIYLKQLILYINNNPVHHGFCEQPGEYSWSSYNSLISIKNSKLMRSQVIEWFDDTDNFIYAHHAMVDYTAMDNWLDI